MSDWDDWDDHRSERHTPLGKTARTNAPSPVDETIAQKIAAQRAYCDGDEIPDFAPADGICWACGGQIYAAITLAKAGSERITGCPLCCRSFCD